MKHKLLYLLLLLMILGAGCGKTSNTAPSLYAPDGSYSGQFRLLHRHTNKDHFDTLKANITLTLKNSDGTYSVTGDTTTLHAGSFGTYGINNLAVNFTDKTYPSTGTPTKVHLNGLYQLYYDGSIFQMLSYSADTLSYQYDLKKNK